MLSIRMQRKGRTGHAQFRVVVQDSRFHPSSGRVVAYVGNYDPHTKAAKLDGEKISKYLQNGAQPSDRVAKLLSQEGIKLPGWFTPDAPKKGAVRNPDKRRSTRPEQPVKPEAPVADLPTEAEAEAGVTVETAEAIKPEEAVSPVDETVAKSEQTPEAEVEAPEKAADKPAPGPEPEKPAQ